MKKRKEPFGFARAFMSRAARNSLRVLQDEGFTLSELVAISSLPAHQIRDCLAGVRNEAEPMNFQHVSDLQSAALAVLIFKGRMEAK